MSKDEVIENDISFEDVAELEESGKVRFRRTRDLRIDDNPRFFGQRIDDSILDPDREKRIAEYERRAETKEAIAVQKMLRKMLLKLK